MNGAPRTVAAHEKPSISKVNRENSLPDTKKRQDLQEMHFPRMERAMQAFHIEVSSAREKSHAHAHTDTNTFPCPKNSKTDRLTCQPKYACRAGVPEGQVHEKDNQDSRHLEHGAVGLDFELPAFELDFF